MVDIKLFDGMYGGLEQVLDLRSRQHELIATNLANADTPGFTAREIPFETMLTQVMEGAINEQPMSEADFEPREIEADPWVRDGNSVNPEREATKMSSNSLLYNAVSTATSHRLSMLRFAASNGKL
jgi:flagellar basal-body rod protein FlgB